MEIKTAATLLAVILLSGCSVAAKDLKKDVGALTVPTTGSPENVASLIASGISNCAWAEPIMRKDISGVWIVSYVQSGIGADAYGPNLVVEVGKKNTVIAPRFGFAVPARRASIVAEWVEKKQITRCNPVPADIERWESHHKKLQ